MTYDTLIDRQTWPANQHLSARTLDKVSSILSEDFTDWLYKHELTQRQIARWMGNMHDQGWAPVNRIYRDFTASPHYADLDDYLKDNKAACLTLLRWIKACSEAHWPGIDGVYDQFVNWVAAQEIKQ